MTNPRKGKWAANNAPYQKQVEELKQRNDELNAKNADLKRILHLVINSSDTYFKWMEHYGNHTMTNQKQSLNDLKEKITIANEYL